MMAMKLRIQLAKWQCIDERARTRLRLPLRRFLHWIPAPRERAGPGRGAGCRDKPGKRWPLLQSKIEIRFQRGDVSAKQDPSRRRPSPRLPRGVTERNRSVRARRTVIAAHMRPEPVLSRLRQRERAQPNNPNYGQWPPPCPPASGRRRALLISPRNPLRGAGSGRKRFRPLPVPGDQSLQAGKRSTARLIAAGRRDTQIARHATYHLTDAVTASFSRCRSGLRDRRPVSPRRVATNRQDSTRRHTRLFNTRDWPTPSKQDKLTVDTTLTREGTC
jgi:hypothetical protein